MARRPIDQFREGAGMLEIADPEDPSPISGFLQISDDRLFVIKERSVFEILLADNIDPDRINPNIPNSYQKILKCGSSDEDFSRILMMVDHLCDMKRVKEHIDRNFVITSTIRLQERLCRIKDYIEIIENEENLCNNIIEDADQIRNKGYQIPQIQNLDSTVKLCAVEMRKCFNHIFDIFNHAFKLNKQIRYTEIRDLLARIYGEADDFVQFLDEASESFTFFRTLRNSIEHPKHNEKLEVENFQILPSGEIYSPTIRFVYRKKTYGPAHIVSSLKENKALLIEICERFLAFTFSYQMKEKRNRL